MWWRAVPCLWARSGVTTDVDRGLEDGLELRGADVAGKAVTAHECRMLNWV